MTSEVESREFPLADVLTVATGRLLSRDFADLYEILSFLVGEGVMTHQIPRAIGACYLGVLGQHPELVDVVPPDGDRPSVEAWLAEQVRVFGERLALRPVAGWEHRDPLVELAQMCEPRRTIVVDTSGRNP